MPESGVVDAAAQEFVDQAWEAATPAAREKYARRALAIDPRAVDAYVILGLSAETSAERIALLREGVRIGSITWAGKLKRPLNHWFWLEIETRPYMRAVHNLALALWERGDREAAASLTDHLVRINPNDNQGARYLGLSWHAVLGNWDRVERILKRYKGEASTEYLYAKCLNSFRRGEDAKEILEAAIGSNPHVPALLLSSRLVSGGPNPGYLQVGSKAEALSYATHNIEAWKSVPTALQRLQVAMR